MNVQLNDKIIFNISFYFVHFFAYGGVTGELGGSSQAEQKIINI